MESMASGGRSETAGEEEGQIPLDIDNVHLLLQVEQEQIQKRTFTNWINAQLVKHRPPTVVLDLFTDVRDGNRLLDLLEVISGQPMSRERGRSIFQCRANIETALTFLRRKSIKLVNINIPDIIEGKPSIVLGLIWTIILHFHIEELANSLAFSSRQSSMESLASIDSCSTIDSSSSRRSGTLHTKFKLSAKKALLLWAREQCQKAGANISIKDFKSSWRSGLAFLAILNSLRPNLVDLQKTKSRTNRENLEEAFRTAEHELKIPRLLEPEDVDINDPDDKSIMTYVAQFLQYSKDLPVSEEEMQGNLNQKVKGVTSWLTQAEQELEGSIGEADKESYEEKFHAFQTFVTTFNEQKRPIMPLLTAMRKTTQLTEDQVRLKEAWNKVTSKIREYKVALDLDLPFPLDGVGVWLQKIEPVLGEEIAESQDHEEVAGRIRDTLHLLKSLMEEMDVHWQTLQKFPNKDENGATRVPQEKIDELKRRFTSARVTAKYHGIKLEYQESKHSVQALICAVNSKLNTWKKKYGTKESVKLLQLDWHDFVEKQSFVTCLEAATEKLKLVASNYTSRTALAADSQYINKFLKQVDCDSSVSLASIRNVKAILARVVSGWDTYTENYNLLQQWLKDAQAQTQIHTAEVMSDWSTRHGRLNEAGNFLIEVTNEQTSSQLSEEMKKLNRQWADFIKRTTFEIIPQPCESPRKTDKTAAINIMIDEATQILHERVDISASSLRTYIKRLEDLKRKIEEVDLDFILQSPEKSPVEFPPVKNVKDTLSEIADKCSGVQQDCQLLLSHVVTLESSLALLELWESEAGDIFNSLNTKQKGQEIDKKSLQLLITRGKELERQVATAQEIVLIVAENIAKNRSLHHLQASGLQSRVNAVKDTRQVTMTNLNSAMQTKEASSSSEADIKLRFESSKQKLQAYITDALALLSEKHTSEERVAKHEETLTRSETNILEEFLEATEQIKQITPSNQQQEVEKISKYLREQWEACFSPEGSLGQADDHLQAMKGICEKLTADSSYSLTKTQLTECEQRKEEIEQRARHVYENLLTRHNEQQSSEKRQSSGHAELKVADVDSPVEAVSSVSSKVLLTTTQVTVRVANIPVVQQAVKLNVEETVPAVQDKQDLTETEVLKSYRESKSVFEVQLKKNRELILSEFPEDMVDTSVLRIKCQELQEAQEETETFWFEFEIQSSQLKGNMREPETRKRINHEWRELKPSLQARLKSMETTVGILVPVEIQVTQLSDLLDQYQKKPKTLKQFTVTGADSVQKDIKELQERIQRHIVNSSVLEKPGSPSVAGLDSRDQLAIHKIVLVCKKKLQKMIYSIHDSEVVMKTMEAFLASLRTAENDIDRLPAAPSADVVALCKSKVKLEVIQKDINSMRDKAVHIDELLNKAEIRLQEAESSKGMTCQQMIAVLSQKLEDTKEFIMKHEQNLQQEEVVRPILVRKEDLIKNLREVQQKTDSEGLKEPTLPALQQRLRSLKELRNNLGSFEGELLKLRETANQLVLMSSEEKAKHLVDLETLWEETERSVTDRLKSMDTAVGFLVPLDNEVAQLSDSLDQFKKRPKTLKRFTMPGAASVQKDLKELQRRIQRNIRNSSAFEKLESPAAVGLDPRDQQAIQSTVLVCKNKLEEMDHSMHDSEVAMKTLEAFLASLRTAENDIDHLQAAPSSDVVSIRKSKVKLEVIQQDINSMRDKAVHIDELLNKAEICLQEAESSKGMTCQQMIAVLSQKLEDTKEFIMKREQSLQQEEVLRPILVRKADLIKNLREVQQKTDSEGLKEPTLPALQQRLRSLKELRNNLGSFEGELLKLRETANQLVLMSSEEKAKHLVDLETLWEETERSVTDRLKSMETAVGFLVPLDNEVAQLSDSLDQFKKRPKTLKRFTMPGAASVQKDLKELQRRIQRNIRNSSAFEKLESLAAAGLDPRDQQAIQSIVLVCKNKLEEMDHSMHDSEVAMKTLEAFLVSLRMAENDIDRLQAAPSSDVVSIRKSKVELEAIQQDINSMRDKAVHMDELLNKAEICLQEAESSKGMTCQQMIVVLSQKLEDTKEFIMKHEQNLQQEVLRSILVKKNALMTRLQEVQEKADGVGLMEPTLPALHKRLRILEELENQMRSCEGDLQRLRERANQIPPTSREEETMSLVDLDTLWEETERTVTEGQEQCSVLMGLLKKFQGYRSDLSNTLQRAETTISEQASYMGKDNLHRLIEKVGTMKEELSGSSDHIDEIRTVCRQLQSQLKKIQSCEDTAFESEADSLVDRWLDVTEKTDIYLDNIKCGLTLWEKLISLAGDIEEWTTIKLGAFSEHHRFRNQQEITDLEDEIQAQERNIERFNCRAAEIQELLQSKDSPLELQVIETQLKKRMEQVKELYEDSSEVFQEFTAVKKHIADRLIQSHCCLQAIQESVHSLAVSDHPNIFDRLKHINKDLLNQTEQVDSLLVEINVLASVANPQDLEELNRNGAKLTENLQSVQELLLEKVHSTEDHFIHQLSDEVKVNEDWLQDIQLSVNECFEYPEQRQDVEASLHKLNDFLMSEDGEKKIHNIKKRFSEIRTHLPVKHVNQISGWLEDQEAELKTFTSHCQQKHRDLQDCLESLNKLQEEYTLLDRWLQSKVQKSLPAEGLEQFYQEIVKEREKFDGLISIVDSLRKQGLTYDQAVKESSKLIERYQNLLVQVAAETEAQEALSKDLEAFDSLRDGILAWIMDLKESIDTVRSTEGSKSMIKERIQRTEEILQRKPEGDLKIQLLNDAGTKLAEKMRLDNRRRPETKQTIVEITGQWNSALQSAEEHYSHLKEILGRWNSYLEAKEKVQLKISEISQQKLDLSVEFVWPDLTGKYESLEKCRMLLQEAHSILTAFDMLKVQKDALFHLTHDVNFNEASWVEMLNPNYCLLKDLKGLVHTLEDSIERHHHYQKLLKEFHTTQDSFSEEIPSLRATPKERPALEKTLNRLKGMLNPISRQEEVIRDVTALGDSLKKNTTRSGQTAITQEIQSLQSQHQDTRRAIVQMEEHCEGLLNEILLSEKEFTRRVQRMKQDAGELEEELSVLSQTLSPIQENSSLDDLAEHWRVNMGTKNTLDRLESRVENLKADQQFCTSQQMLPEATVAAAEVIQKYYSLLSQTSDGLHSSKVTLENRFFKPLQALQQWTLTVKSALCVQTHLSPDSALATSTIQDLLNHCEMLKKELKDVLPYQELLMDAVGQEQSEKLATEISNTLQEENQYTSTLCQELQALEDKKRHEEESRYQLSDALARETGIEKETPQPELPEEHQQIQTPPTIQDQKKHEEKGNYQLIDCPDEEVGAEVEQTLQPDLLEQQIQRSETHQDILVPPGEGQKELIEVRSVELLQIDTRGQEKMMELEMSSSIASPGTFGETKRYEDKKAAGSATVTGLDQEETPLPDLPVEQQLIQTRQAPHDHNKLGEEANRHQTESSTTGTGQQKEPTSQPGLPEQQRHRAETHQELEYSSSEGLSAQSKGPQFTELELDSEHVPAADSRSTQDLQQQDGNLNEMQTSSKDFQLGTETASQLHRPAECMDIEGDKLKKALTRYAALKTKLETELIEASQRVSYLKIQAAELNIEAMNKQLNETEEVSRDFEQKQAAALKQMEDAEVSELRTVTNVCVQTDVEHIQAQWNKHVQDLSSLKQSKESQLSLIKEYHCSADAVKHLFEKLSAELETLEQGPVESCSLHAETVQKILSTIEQEKVILKELGEKQEQISHHLNETEKKALQFQLEHWDQKGNQMASAAERTLNVVSKEVEEYRCLLLESQELQKQVDNLQLSLTDLKGSPPEEEIDKRKSWMILSADLTAAQHNFTHLKRSSQILIQHMLGQREKDSLENSVHQLQARLDLMQEQASAHSEEEEEDTSSATTIGKVMKVIKEAFMWVKKADGDITANNRIALFPEDVSVQIKNLKELQSEIIAKQSTMDSFVSEVKVLMSGLDEKDVPKVSYLLQTLSDLHKSAAQKSTQKLHELESALQARERLFEKIASINTWLEAHTEKEHIKENDSESNTLELEHQVEESNDILHESKEQEMLLESLLMNSKEISAEINISENYYLSDRLKCLQNNIKRVITSQKKRCWNVEEMLNTRKNTEGKLESLACNLKETMSYMNIDGILLSKDAVSTRNALKLKILEHKSQLDQLCSCEYFEKEKLSELQSLLADAEKKMKKLNSSVQEYEQYQTVLQNIKHLKERAEKEILHIKEAPGFKIDKLKRCQVLLLDLQQWMLLCQQSGDTLNKISPTLDPTLLDSEEQRIQYLVEECNKWNQALQKESLDLEKQLLEEQDFQTVQESTLDFLREARHELASSCMSLDQEVIERKLQECKALQNYMQVRMRILKSLEHKELDSLKKAASDSPGTMEKKCNEMEDMERQVKDDCASRMDILIKAKEAAREYDEAVRSAADFLCQSEASLLPRPINVSFCELQLQQHQENLSKCHAGFESKISDMQQILPRLESISHTFLPQHANILSELLVRNAVLRGQAEIKLERMQRCVEKYKNYKEYKQEISTNFNNLERMFATSISQKATSYKESVEQLEKLKILVAKLDSMEDLVKLRAIASELQCEEWDSSSIKQEVSALWYAWLQLQQPAKEHQVSCENLYKEWKAVNENIKRAAIILDNLQDDLPECSKEKAAKEVLLDLQKHVNQYEDSVNNEQSSLVFLVHKVKGLLGVTENVEVPSIPICQELQAMQDRYKKLKQKAMESRRSVHTEIQEREKVKDEIRGVKEWLLPVVSLLSVVDHTPNITELEEVQTELDAQRAVVKNIMAKLKIKYSNMDAIVPAEIEAQLQEVSRTLQEVGEQVEKAVVQNRHHHLLHNKIEDITNGLQNVDKMLQQKNQTINQAKEMQKRVWDEVDRWHCRLTSLEAEVQDLAEQNPNQAQQMMDSLMEPLQLYQRAAQQAEQRTAFLSKITNCLQEYNEMINSSNVWIDDTQAWLSMEFVFDSAKSLHKNVKALQIARDDGLQRQKTLQGFAPILQEISLICDTMALEQQGSHVDQKITALLDGIMGPLSQLQHVATELEAMETEVKLMEKNVAKIRTILSSDDMDEISPEEHLRNREVILENIQSMKKTIAEIKNYEPREAIASLVVYKRAEQLLPAMEELEHTTVQQKAVLQSAIEQLIGQRQDMEIVVQEEYPDEMSTSPAEYTQPPTGFRIPQIPAEGYSIDRLYYEGPDTGSEDGGSTKSSSSETLTGSILEEHEETFTVEDATAVDTVQMRPDNNDMCETQAIPQEMTCGVVSFEPEEHHTPEDLNTENTSSVQLEAEDNETSSMQPVPHEEEHEETFTVEDATAVDTVQMRPDNNDMCETQAIPQEMACGVVSFAGPGELQQLPGRPEPHSILHVCRERAAQLEFWLEKATATFRADRQDMEMQQSVAQQLLMCQSMFLEIEQKVAFLSDLAQQEEAWCQEGTASTHQEAEALSSKLEGLKSSLVKFQMLLQERHNEEQDGKHPSETPLQRSASVQEMLASAKTKLNRQDSLQQQKELEMELSEQKDLTKYLALHGERMLLQKEGADAQQQASLRTSDEVSKSPEGIFMKPLTGIEASAHESEDQASTKWQRLQNRLSSKLKTLEETAHQDLFSQDVLDNTWSTLRVAREELKESLTTEIQYESLLQGLSSLVDAGHEKLARNQHLVLPSRTVLKSHLKKHKNYFHNLGNHLAAVERFSQKVPVALARKHDKFWLDLVEEIRSLQQQALHHGIRIQSMLQAWTHFDKSSTVLLKELQELEARIPTIGLVEESEERLLERLAIYQQIKGSLDENCSRLSQTLTNGKKLLTTVSCTELESGLRQLEEKWLTVMNRVDYDRHCLETLTKYWTSFRKGSIELSVWMMSAMDRLRSLKQQSLSVPQDLEKVRDHLGQFLEFMKEVDAKSSVKSSLISTGNQLLQVKQTDTASLQNQLAQFEQGWMEVLTPLPGIQEKLHQLQMEKVPSHQAITELKTWMSKIHGLLREDEEKISRLSTTASAKEILQKYKDYKTEMNCKQLTVDFVNQSVLQISSLDIQSKRYDMAEFAECLGALNLQWQLLQGALSSKMRAVEHMLTVFTEKERKMQLISCWCKAQGERILGFQTPASLTSAENALKDCQEIEEKLKIKSKEIQELKHYYLSPADDSSEHLHIDFITQMDEVNADWARLNNQDIQAKASLQSTVQQWKAFDETFQEVDLNIIKARYTLELSHFPVLSFEALKSQVEKLKSLLEDAEKNEESWNALSSVFTTLKTMCSPTAVKLITENLEDARTRWTAVNQDSSDELRKAQSLYQLWQKYRNLFIDSTLLLKTHEEECSKLLSAVPSEESTVDFMQRKIDTINKLVNETENMQSITAQVSEASKELIQQVDPSAAILIESEVTNLSNRLAQLGKLLAIKLSERQDELKQLEEFNRCLASLEHHLKDSEGIVANTKDPNISDPSTMDQSRTRMLKLYAITPDLEYLNDLSYKIPLNDLNIKRVQTLNRQWAQASSRALERCSELQGVLLDKQNFVQKCENWMRFLEKMEDSLAVDIAGCYVGLKEQQRIHELFQAELSIGHQILHSVINEGRNLLERGEVEDRSEFILKLSLLKEQWQGAIRRAQQRKGVIEGLVRQWHHYQDSLKKLKTFLSDTANHLDLSNSQAHHGLHQTRREVEDIKHKEMLFQRHRCSYILTLETGKQIFSMANPETETLLQEELCELQESWEHTETLLKEKKQLMNTSLESWENCENKINEFGRRLQDIKIKVSDPLPQVHEELQATEKQTKEAEESLEDWTRSLAELSTMKTDLSHYIITDDVVILQEQIQHLHSQWDELCLKVSLRKQEIADRLNAWIIFNEKNKELCEWLTEMENKVSHNAELSIEEMVEKLKKDCMEEINLFSENKTHLKILGEQLLNASNKTKETEINDKLKDINDRWQHLFDHIEARVKKLKETQVTVQQLDKNMSNLRTWLSHIEAELSKPVVYNICDNDEIQKKLSEQQDLQRDIEQHTDGVVSVINLCDVLLHDSDACATETECDSIQQTTASLDRRWRNICAMSMERRMKIEETCRLWSKFLDDYSRFEDWLKTAERTAACPNSAEVLYTSAKEELKKFEAFQRQVHERLTQLELVNKQYRRLARENRTDTASRLKLMVHEGNQRWDNLQKRVAAILRRLKYFTSQREEFEGTRDGILVWLTEMDLQLTNVEHFSESDIEDKMRQLDGFQQEITLNTNKIDQLIVFGENLIQKSQPLDAVLIEDELEELHSYCQEVFGRVARFHHRLINKGPVSEDEKESSDRDTDLEDSAELQGIGWQEKMGHEVSPSCQSMCQLMPPTAGQERSGRETPISVDSIPLEWDHTVDVGGSSSHEDEEEPVYYSALSVKSPSEPPSWHSPDHQDSRKQRIQTEIIRNLSSTSPTTSTPYKLGYVKLMSECSGSIDSVKRVKLILNDEEQLEEQGLVGLTTAEKQSGVIERWELIQAQGLSNKLRKKQNLQQWQQLNSDLHDITSWMKQIEPELDELQKLQSSTSIQDIEGNIKKLKEIQKAFDNYKSVVISLNLISKDFQQADSDESQELHGRLGLMNQSWVQACNKLDCWKEGLQTALMQCQDFHETTHDLLLWLAHAVSRRYTVDLADSNIKSCVLQEHQKTLMQLEGDLLEKQLQVSSLQEISTHLLVKADEEDHIEAKEKVHVIENKLKLLLREVSQDMQTIQKKLDTCSSFSSLDEVDCSDIAMTNTPLSQIKEASEEKITATKASTNTRPGRRESSPPRSFFYRVLRAAFPLQVLFLLLLVLACLVPLTEEDYSCSLSNNFARSFYPMLRYTNGPPPT